ncbi:MAG: hypothetical protein Q9207_003686 [Kuettlingeria erythrocarpa]
MPLSVLTIFVFADRTSLLFVANLPLLYLFAAKNQPIKLLTGYSYESLNILHRRLGEVMCLLALLHSAGMIGVWYTILRPTGFSLARFLLSKIILLGIGAFIAYELIYFTSLGSFRQRWYELFLALHVLLQVVALILVWFHHHNSRPYVGVALAIFLVDRLFYRMALKRHSSRTCLEVCKDGQTVILRTKIVFSQKWNIPSRIIGTSISTGWKSTEHVFLTIPALSRKHIIQAHPFTIASKAPCSEDSEGQLKLIIRAQDGFSKDLVTYAKGHTSVQVALDGPYGSQNALQLLRHCDLSVVIAGGSGIAVALPLVWALQASRNHDLEKTMKRGFASRIVLIWVTRQESHASWVGSAELQGLQEHGVEIIMPPPTASNGHPNVPRLLSSWISTHDDTLFDGHARVGVAWTLFATYTNIKTATTLTAIQPRHDFEANMDASTASISLLEKAGLNTLLPLYENAEKIQSLIAVLETRSSELLAFLRKLHRWVDSATGKIDAGQPPSEHVRLVFQAYEDSSTEQISEATLTLYRFSEAITDHMEILAKLAQDIYCGIVTLQRDLMTDRELLAWMHDDLDRAKSDVVALAELWLNLQSASRSKLFGNATDDGTLEDPQQPPPSPASDSSHEIIVDQEVALHSTMARGVTRRKHLPHDTGPAVPVSPTTTAPLAFVLMLLMILHFLKII